MLTRTTRLSAAALTVAVLAALSASPASAQAPSFTIDDLYQQSTETKSLDGIAASANCTNTQSCFYLFSRVKKGRQLIVTQISCTIPHNAGDVRFAALQPEANGQLLLRKQFFVPVPTTDDRVGFSAPTLQLFDSGERPVVEVVFDEPVNIFGTCTIAGRLVNAN